ncbi:MAG: hypothetical protein WCF84_02415 [Anaerolineae bacterium]
MTPRQITRRMALNAYYKRTMAFADMYQKAWKADSEPTTCPECGGDGELHTCWDDLCQDGCIHGDGDVMCPRCEGEGMIYV